MADDLQIFCGGSVFTAVRSAPWAEAVVIGGGKIVSVGELRELRDAWPSAAEVDLDGGMLLPGFIDAHNHFLSTGESLASLDLRFPGIDSPGALLRVIVDAAKTTPAGETISGFGFDNAKYELPSIAELDRVTGDHPLQLFHTSGHHVLVNSVVLRRSGVTEDTADPAGGRFVRDGDGRLTGLCLDAACGAVIPTAVDIGSHGPNFHTNASTDDLVAAVDRASQAFRAAGITCVADAQVTSRELRGYRTARERGVLGVRTVCMPLSHQLDDFEKLGLVGPFGDDLLSIGHLKIYADGSLTGGTASFSADLPVVGQSGSYYHDPSTLRGLIECAWGAGWRIGVHAQGDAAIAAVLDGYEMAAQQFPRADARPRIEHAGLPLTEGIRRMEALGVIAVQQPSYLHDFGDEYLESMGELAHELQPWRALLDASVSVVLSSDSDVTSYRPLTTISNAMQRKTRLGVVLGGYHRLTLQEALFAHTIDAAFAVVLEGRIGSLEPGKAADLTWVAADLRDISAEEIADVDVVSSLLAGVSASDRAFV